MGVTKILWFRQPSYPGIPRPVAFRACSIFGIEGSPPATAGRHPRITCGLAFSAIRDEKLRAKGATLMPMMAFF
jgi:hypothetical protein